MKLDCGNCKHTESCRFKDSNAKLIKKLDEYIDTSLNREVFNSSLALDISCIYFSRVSSLGEHEPLFSEESV